jgi:hypothetical protein
MGSNPRRGSDSLGAETQLFAHILDSHYNTPPEMAYDGDHCPRR